MPIPGYPWVPWIYIGATLAASGFLVARRPAEALWGLGTLGVGVLIYGWIRRSEPQGA